MKLLKNKKVFIVVSSVFVIAIFAITLSLTLASDNEIFQANVKEKKVNKVGGFLTLMLETEAGSGQYQESTAGTWPGDGYVFNNELSSCQNGSELSWNEELGAVTLSTSISDSCYVYFDLIPPTFADTCREIGSNTLACYVATQYTTDGDNGLYYHDADLENGAGDNSYRYAGANPNNYVCFGSDVTPCPSDNLYRIIGVFDNEVKLIKADYTTMAMTGSGGDYVGTYGTYYGNTSDAAVYHWSGGGKNIWGESALNTTNLNDTYLNSLSIWSNLISTHSWKTGGMSYSNGTSTPKNAYNYEVGLNSSSTTWSGKIGLMYVSDYGYAASNNYWTTNMSSYSSAINNNWMYMELMEWIISYVSDYENLAFFITSSGDVYRRTVGSYIAVRPVFYLNSDVEYSSGSGTESDPIRIVVDSSSPSEPSEPPPTNPGGPSTGDGDWEGGLQ